MTQLENKVAIVTGAGRGMGRSISELFAREGAKVYALDLKFSDNQQETPDGILRIEELAVDICDFAAVKEAVVKIKKQIIHYRIRLLPAPICP